MANSKNLIKTTVSTGISLGILFVTFWIISKAWNIGQRRDTIVMTDTKGE